ncbi:helix-turn-helix domain-containing protein [Mucilaginibacter flavidus]|uniref:helix-turn-helix domain-containing protein n=1 Tax=Mucilaginibacter flavidus TaxID=2949309 RepID=UPI0020933354|nr:AraC family transcriptional regulator [Mucilaginibacter flavidus]MCO5947989.1 AraC family transcriptional regulator [Mucilaginibacter flavidus]
MDKQVFEQLIPKYSLEQVSRNRSYLLDILELDRFHDQDITFALTPHRNDFYILLLVKEGGGRHWVDTVQYALKPDTFYFSTPQQVLIKEETQPLNGTLLRFTNEFLAIEDNQLLKKLLVIQNPHNGHELTLSAENVTFIEDIFTKMLVEYNQRHDLRNGMLFSYLRVLLIYLSRLYTEQLINNIPNDERRLLKKFVDLINEKYNQLHDVSAYADLLCISAGHLSKIIKQQSGKTGIQHIHERLMLEAKRLLLHTECSVKEIAFQLGFDDAPYFNRFFKRLARHTPAEYRKMTRKMYH